MFRINVIIKLLTDDNYSHFPIIYDGLHGNKQILLIIGLHDIPVNTTHLYNFCTMLCQRRKRWADVVQMLHKCFLFAGM